MRPSHFFKFCGLLLTLVTSLQCTAAQIEGCEYTGTCDYGPHHGSGGRDAGPDSAMTATGGASGAAGGRQSTGGANANGGGIGGSDGGPDGSNGVGGSGGSSNGGSGGATPCGGECAAPTPVCKTATNACVECTKGSQCKSTKPACDPATNTCVRCVGNPDCASAATTPVCNVATNACVQCLGGADCAGKPNALVCDTGRNTCVQCLGSGDCAGKPGTPVCDTATNTCVQCLGSSDCASRTATPVCNTGTNTCVQCLATTDCKDAAAARCDANVCKPCTAKADCDHISGKGVCDVGACVQCTASNAAACGKDQGTALVCDSTLRTCSMHKEQSAGLCDACVSDAQCALGELCVLDTLGSGSTATNVGYFCHWKQGDTTNGAPADCTSTGRPYVRVLSAAKSIDGQTADVCTLAVSSCPARSEFRSTNCAPTGTPNDALCGVSPPADAKCAKFGTTTYLCTMTCGSDLDCPTGFPCLTGANPPVCQL